MDDDDRSRIQDNYKGNYDRLVAIKRTYDPDNLFHLNQNIAPSGPSSRRSVSTLLRPCV